jgi:hypothetical protein
MGKNNEKTIKSTGWKKVDNEEKAQLGGIHFSIVRLRSHLWQLRRWDPDKGCWVVITEEEVTGKVYAWEGAPWDLKLIAKQTAWRIFKSKG